MMVGLYYYLFVYNCYVPLNHHIARTIQYFKYAGTLLESTVLHIFTLSL